MRMNFQERKNLIFRLISTTMLAGVLGFDIYVFIYIVLHKSSNQIISIIGCVFAFLMILFESILLLRGWTKESALYKIAFNPNQKLNNVPFIAVIIATLFGLGFIILGTLLNVLKHEEPFITSSFVILIIATYLLTNCLIYFLYCFMFKKREINLKDFIK